MSEKQEYWFVARTRINQEFAFRDLLKKLEIGYFLPTRVVVRQWQYRCIRVETPVFTNLVFVHATKEKVCLLIHECHLQLFYIKDRETGSMLIVPDKQMQDFMFVMDLNPNGMNLDNDALSEASKVRVIKGKFTGIEGELVKISNQTHVMIRIPQVFSVTVKIPKRYLEVIA
ncbi:Transcription antitermination protein RfaH [termite gut metagenome]|uniref:Transcription antitermination protein RfaH n=1 Tax=termite gut metagenome TaxID=433724 RepID=A0A5J4T3H8_9ZZZZ